MFKLDALKARHGDCLLLHWGAATKPRTCLIDGGPSTVYRQVLRPRLQELAAERDGRVDLELVMVSHIDDDHINGLLEMAKEIEDNRAGSQDSDGALPVRVKGLWHNSLENLLDDPLAERATASVTASTETALTALPASNETEEAHGFAMVLASVPQGQRLHRHATVNDWRMNWQFDNPPLVLRRNNDEAHQLKGLHIRVIAPGFEQLEVLRKKWRVKRDESIVAAYSDSSPFNLSSIVVLVEFEGRTMLLTGDARGDHILEGLEACNLLDRDGMLHVDLIKLPHHGSQYNITRDFFVRVTADHYVVSGDRDRFPNPAKIAMKWLHQARGGDDYKVYCTYEFADMVQLFGKQLFTPTNKNFVTASLD